MVELEPIDLGQSASWSVIVEVARDEPEADQEVAPYPLQVEARDGAAEVALASAPSVSAPEPPSHAACETAIAVLREALDRVAQRADGALGEASSASGSADMVVMNVRMVGAMMSQIHHGIENVSAATERSTHVAQRTAEGVATTGERVDHLAALGLQIGSIVKVIAGLADQTRMLALNAKIEAARAGVHGRGFAVVADEVKELARASAAAADEIENRIDGVSRATAEAARAMHATTESVGQIHALIREIADGVREQRELAESVKGYVDEAADSVDGIAQGLARVGEAIGDAIASARATLAPELVTA